MAQKTINKAAATIERAQVPLRSQEIAFKKGMVNIAKKLLTSYEKKLFPELEKMEKDEQDLFDTRDKIRAAGGVGIQDADTFKKSLDDEAKAVTKKRKSLEAALDKAKAAGREARAAQLTEQLTQWKEIEKEVIDNVAKVKAKQVGITKTMAEINKAVVSGGPADLALGKSLAVGIFTKQHKTHLRTFSAGINQVITLSTKDILKDNAKLKTVFKARVKETQKLIKSLKPDGHKRLTKLVNGMFGGDKTNLRKSLASQIRAEALRTWETIDNRAQLIAVDQMNTYASDLQQERAKQAGITHYFWQDSRDERVRPVHKKYNRQRFAFADPPPEGNPGKPIRCRCTAKPDLTTIMKKGSE